MIRWWKDCVWVSRRIVVAASVLRVLCMELHWSGTPTFAKQNWMVSTDLTHVLECILFQLVLVHCYVLCGLCSRWNIKVAFQEKIIFSKCTKINSVVVQNTLLSFYCVLAQYNLTIDSFFWYQKVCLQCLLLVQNGHFWGWFWPVGSHRPITRSSKVPGVSVVLARTNTN